MEQDEEKSELIPVDNRTLYDILVVDDERDILNSLNLVLGYADEFQADISVATDGQTALQHLEKKEFDLVLSDYKMPGMTGVELLTKVKERYPNTIRMLITGYTDVAIAREAINKAHVHNYIEKPWDNDDLTLTLYEALKRKTKRADEEIKEIDQVKDALKLVNDLRDKVLNEQKLVFSFNSILELNKFSFGISKMANVRIEDFHVFENRYIINIIILPELFTFTP